MGAKTGEEVARREHLDNHWAVLTAATRDRQALLTRDKQHSAGHHHSHAGTTSGTRVLGGGVAALHELSRQLWLADKGGRSECVEYAVLAQLLSRSVPGLDREDLELICNHFDAANDGHCDYRRLLAAVRGGELSEVRRQAVVRVYQQLDARGEDSVSVGDMRQQLEGQGAVRC